MFLPHLMRYFNSIKVRLKPGDAMPDIKAIGTFQFHKGTIKTQVGELLPIFSQISIP